MSLTNTELKPETLYSLLFSLYTVVSYWVTQVISFDIELFLCNLPQHISVRCLHLWINILSDVLHDAQRNSFAHGISTHNRKSFSLWVKEWKVYLVHYSFYVSNELWLWAIFRLFTHFVWYIVWSRLSKDYMVCNSANWISKLDSLFLETAWTFKLAPVEGYLNLESKTKGQIFSPEITVLTVDRPALVLSLPTHS